MFIAKSVFSRNMNNGTWSCNTERRLPDLNKVDASVHVNQFTECTVRKQEVDKESVIVGQHSKGWH